MSSSLVCDVCGKVFGFPSALRVHAATHLPYQERPFPCTHYGCTKRFSDALGLSAHSKTHATERPRVQCGVGCCDKTFLQERTAAKHRAQVHGTTHPQPLSRDVTLSSGGLLEVSSPSDAPSGSESITTPGPGATTVDDEVPSEQKVCIAAGLAKCDECGKVFQSTSWLRVHLRWHRGLPPYECPRCLEAFSSADKLKRHRDSKHHNPSSSSQPWPASSIDHASTVATTTITAMATITTPAIPKSRCGCASSCDGGPARCPQMRLKAALLEIRALCRIAEAHQQQDIEPSSPSLSSSSSSSSSTSTTTSTTTTSTRALDVDSLTRFITSAEGTSQYTSSDDDDVARLWNSVFPGTALRVIAQSSRPGMKRTHPEDDCSRLNPVVGREALSTTLDPAASLRDRWRDNAKRQYESAEEGGSLDAPIAHASASGTAASPARSSACPATASVSSGTDPLDTLYLLLGVGGGSEERSTAAEGKDGDVPLRVLVASPSHGVSVAIGTEDGGGMGVSVGTGTDFNQHTDGVVVGNSMGLGTGAAMGGVDQGIRSPAADREVETLERGGISTQTTMTATMMSTGTDPIDFSLLLPLDGDEDCGSGNGDSLSRGFVNTGTDPVDFDIEALLS